MKKILLVSVMVALSAAAVAGPKCTSGDDRTKWIPEDQFKQKLMDEGYDLKKFKTTSGGCYEIYGHNAQGQKVEIYYNPETAAVVKEEIDD